MNRLTLAIACALLVFGVSNLPAAVIYDTITSADGLTLSDIQANGWRELYNEPYAHWTNDGHLQDWLTNGDDYLMLGGTDRDGNIILAAAILRDNLAPHTLGNDTNTFPETSMWWYNREDYSIGFAPNSTVRLTSADTWDTSSPLRLSWHMHTFSVGGWRLGSFTGLNSSTLYNKFVYTANAQVPEPASIAIWSALGVAGLFGARRRRKSSV